MSGQSHLNFGRFSPTFLRNSVRLPSFRRPIRHVCSPERRSSAASSCDIGHCLVLAIRSNIGGAWHVSMRVWKREDWAIMARPDRQRVPWLIRTVLWAALITGQSGCGNVTPGTVAGTAAVPQQAVGGVANTESPAQPAGPPVSASVAAPSMTAQGWIYALLADYQLLVMRAADGAIVAQSRLAPEPVTTAATMPAGHYLVPSPSGERLYALIPSTNTARDATVWS